ncbi:hypothetical protein K469DRAFT_723051 [Zopfia rhizophila CBS 207.26]|uniref:Uncharacterized protein n=1 Tax=Zopfia rhizophila CBS 207.26 TaxID=1314779 RepID=A0A6A6EDW0_9PEZI|nr:hypothetical protein K469DRAFT_723051 [Zopfia rhizophila CBS 207.26]
MHVTPGKVDDGIILATKRYHERLRVSRVDASSIGTKRKIICFTDTGYILFNNFGRSNECRKILDEQIHSGERSFRDVSEEMWRSLDVPFDDGFEVMEDALDIDLLDHFLGEERSKHIYIVANDVTISSDGHKWKTDEAKLQSDDGTIPMLVFIGDGVTDLPAAREVDRGVIKIVKVDDQKTKSQSLPSNFNPLVNMWRPVYSKSAIPIFAALAPRDEMFV